jgi:hypothetical protein
MARMYAVPVTRISVDYGMIYVEADSAEDAGALRLLDGLPDRRGLASQHHGDWRAVRVGL